MGFGISGRAWAPQVAELKKHHRVLIFDNRGIGESESSKTAYDFGDLADDTVALARHVGFERAHYVGVSMGGMVCQHLAVRHPAAVKSLTLIATHPGGRAHHLVPTLRGLRMFVRANTSRGDKRFAALRQLLYPPHFRADARPEDDFDGDSMEVFAVPADTVTRVNQIKAILKHDVTRDLPGVTAPTLVVRPGADVLVRPRNSDRIHARLPYSRLLRFDDAGHGVTHHKARELNAALLEHFAAADDESATARAA
jgi:pimeloyl-ACP methyl ester carboxylesterase